MSAPVPQQVRIRNRGFTILEILVVVAIISLSVTVILLNLSLSRPDRELGEHAQRLSKTMQLLMQEAILDDKNFALSVVPSGFLVLQYDGAEWQQTEDPFLKSLQQKHDYVDELVIDRNVVAIDKKDRPDPHILILSSGEMTPFQWDIKDGENRFSVRLLSNMLGRITIEGPTENLL